LHCCVHAAMTGNLPRFRETALIKIKQIAGFLVCRGKVVAAFAGKSVRRTDF